MGGTLNLISGERDQDVTTAIPHQRELHGPAAGIHIVAAEPLKEPDSLPNRATQWLVVSDIGLVRFAGDVARAARIRPLAGHRQAADWPGDLRLYAQQQRTGPATTDNKGYVRLDPTCCAVAAGAKPALLMAMATALQLSRSDQTGLRSQRPGASGAPRRSRESFL